MDAPQAPSDAELIARVRNGDLEAYGELYSRHHHAAGRMARQLVPAADADDLSSDAFAKVLDALRGGGGPDVSFRAYLLTTVRRVHVDRIRAGKKVTTTDDIASYEREPETFDDPTVSGFESGAAAKAFAALPERWQAVLWHTEVEGEKPAVIAPLLGLTPNGVSALAYRAREGLRQAYLQQHLADVANDRCRWATERLGAYVRGGLTKRENKHVREHIDECAKCTALYLELVEVNSALPALLAPALLGTAGIGYLAASGVKVGGLGLIGGLWSKVTANGTRTAVTAGTATAVVAAGVIGVWALTRGDDKQVAQNPPAVINTEPTVPLATTQPPESKPTQSPTTTAHTTAPTIAPTTVPTTPPSTTVPTSPPTVQPTVTPTRTPSQPPATLDEGLLTIETPRVAVRGRTVPYVAVIPAAAPAQQRKLTVSPKAGMAKVSVQITYGARLSWPLKG
ncbi:MAG TPA: sigma-70 family RNA polymerase sigma factor, partial [Kribbellaceae bacterium]